MMSPSEKLGILGPWQWIADLSPHWAFVVALLLTPLGIKFILRPLVEGRFVRGRHEFVAFQADALFAPALAAALLLVQGMEDRQYIRSTWPHWLILGGAVCVGIVHGIGEYSEFTMRQLTSVTKLYHGLLFPFLGYLLVVTGMWGFIFAPLSAEFLAYRLIFVLCFLIYGLCVLYDNNHKYEIVGGSEFKTRYDYAHVDDPWPWQHRYRHLRSTWRIYRLSWQEKFTIFPR